MVDKKCRIDEGGKERKRLRKRQRKKDRKRREKGLQDDFRGNTCEEEKVEA